MAKGKQLKCRNEEEEEEQLNTEVPVTKKPKRSANVQSEGTRKKRKIVNDKQLIVSKTNTNMADESDDDESDGDKSDDYDSDADGVDVSKKYHFLCSAPMIYDLVEGLSVEQKEVVNRYGFGGILIIKPIRLPYDITSELIDNYNHNTFVQDVKLAGRYPLTSYDVHDVVAIPHGDIPVKVVDQNGGRRKQVDPVREHDKLVRKKWKDKFPLTGRNGIRLQHLLSHMRSDEMKEKPDDDFIRYFIVYVFGFFLDPSAGKVVDYKILSAVEDVSSITKQNWCAYALKRLGIALNRFMKSGSHKRQRTSISGCLWLLVIPYLHRYLLKGVCQPSKLPLISNWDEQNLKVRVDDENGCEYGSAFLVKSMYPVSNAASVRAIQNDQYEPIQDDQYVPVQDEEIHEDGQSNVRGFIKYLIHEGVMTDAEIDKSFDDDLNKSWIILKRDVEVVIHQHMSRMTKLNMDKVQVDKVVSQATHQLPNENSEHQSQSSQTESEKWWSHPKVIEFMESIDKMSVQFVDDTKKIFNEFEMPSFDLGFDASQRHEPLHEPTPEEYVNKDASVHTNTVREEADDGNGDVGNMVDIAISEKCGDRGANVMFISEMMSTYKTSMLPMKARWKEVCDYCFFKDPEDHDIRKDYEVLVVFSDVSLVSREDMYSLVNGSKIFSSIVDCWCLLINYMRHKKLGPDMRRFCFGTNHSVAWKNVTIGTETMKTMEENYDAMVEALNTVYNPTEDERCELRRGLEEWINMNINSHLLNLQSVKLILIPLYFFEHYTLYVINFEKQKVQYLDNLKFEVDESLKVNELLVSRFFKSLVRELSIVLEELNHTSAKDITGYELENVKQHCDNKGNDCGVFVMKNLELFNGGEKFTCKELANFYKRIMIRAEICATLALADINQVRDELLVKVDDFNNNKEDLSKHVKLKLQEIKIVEQQRQKELTKKKKEEEAMKKKAAADKKKKDVEAKKNKRDEVKNTENQVVEKKDKPIAEKKKNDVVDKQAVGKKDKPIAEKKKNDVVEKQVVGKNKKKVAEQKDQGKTRNSKKK